MYLVSKIASAKRKKPVRPSRHRKIIAILTIHAIGKGFVVFLKAFDIDICSHLLEINSYTDLEDLIQVNTMAISTLTQQDRIIGLQGSLTSHTGQLLIGLGKRFEGVEWLKKFYKIRSHDIQSARIGMGRRKCRRWNRDCQRLPRSNQVARTLP